MIERSMSVTCLLHGKDVGLRSTVYCRFVPSRSRWTYYTGFSIKRYLAVVRQKSRMPSTDMFPPRYVADRVSQTSSVTEGPAKTCKVRKGTVPCIPTVTGPRTNYIACGWTIR